MKFKTDARIVISVVRVWNETFFYINASVQKDKAVKIMESVPMRSCVLVKEFVRLHLRTLVVLPVRQSPTKIVFQNQTLTN